MSSSRRLLILGGIALALWGMGDGLWYAVFAEHQALNDIGSSMTAAFDDAARRNSGAAEMALNIHKEAKYVYDRQVDMHSHWIGLGMLVIVIGIGFDRVRFAERHRLILASALLSGAAIFPFGVMLQTFDHGSMPRAIAILGSALVIVSLAGITLGLAGGRSSAE